jgi:hypothetical protein
VGIGIRLVDAAGPRRGPQARSYIIDRLRPGTTIRRQVEISNSTRSAQSVAVYPDAASMKQGNFAFAPSHSGNELSRWTKVSNGVLHLAPGDKALETVTVKVPNQASFGPRYAVVWAAVSSSGAKGVLLVNRVGIRLYISVGQSALPASFTVGQLIAQRSKDGVPFVAATVINSGQRTLDITGTLTLNEGPGGSRIGPFPVRLVRLTAHASQTVIVRFDKQLPRGPWKARIQLSSGLLKHTVTSMVTFPAGPLSTGKSTSSGKEPLLALLAALAALLFLLSFLLYRHSAKAPR